VWRLIRSDPAESTADAAIVEIGFARARFGRRFARWQETVDLLSSAPHMARLFESRPRFGPIVLADLEGLPHGTLGRVFADHCRARGLDPNLIQISPDDAVGWLLNHLYQTHDVWHVVTGWGNDLAGEVGLGGFYAAQLRSPAFFGYMLALIFFNVISRRADLDEVFAALSAGYRAGRAAEPLFGADWDALFPLPVDEVRQRFAIDRSEVVGEGIRQAA
jgi:ubiquinone biosynthesis protein Coq4